MRRQQRKESLQKKADRYQEKASDLFISSEGPHGGEDLRTALGQARKALLLDPTNYDTIVLIAHIYADIGDQESVANAREFYDRATEIEPSNPRAYISKAELLMYELNDPDEAEAIARKALSLARRDPETKESLDLAYTTLMDILESRGKLQELRWIMRQALKQAPTELLRDAVNDKMKKLGLAVN